MKKQNTKRALLTSVLSRVLCCSMLIGTTFAWFTDSVTSGNNIIKSGNLDIELEYWDGDSWEDVEGKSDILTNTLWEPGVTEVAYLRVANAGTLALKYQLGINIVSETAGVNAAGDPFKLSDYIQFGVVELDAFATYATREDAVADVENAKKISAGYTKAASMTAGQELYLALVVWMPTETGNIANHNGENVPEINLGINVFATQFTYEEDSFDEFYDKDAVATITSPSVALPGATEQATDKVLETPTENNVEVTLPAEFLTDLAQAADAPESVSLSHAEPKFDVTNNRILFEHIELVDENGDIIDLEAIGNDKPITVKFNVGNTFNVGDTVIVYHDGEIFATPEVDADKNVTYTATHFCEVFVGYNDGKIDTAKEFLVSVAAVEDGDVIKLAGDITFTKDACSWNSGSWYDGLYYEGDKSFTIDLNGYTITNDSAVNDYLLNFRNVGEKANEITIKNGTLDATSSAYCAVCTSSSSKQKITINLENVALFGNNSNGSVTKIRGGAEMNVKAGTVITGKNSYLGIECVNSTVNIYDGAEIYMNGTGSYNGCLAGACAGGTINVYGGYGKGVKGGFIAMTSGGTINVYGGKWIANTDGTIGNNSNLYVLTAQSNKYESGFVGPAIINVYGGTFRGGMDAWVLNNLPGEKAELNISGGNFNVNPTRYLVSGSKAAEINGNWTVGTAIVTDADELKAAITNAKDGDIILIANDITIASKWDNRYGGKTNKSITIDGLGNTLKFTGEVNDGFNYHAVFRFEGAATVKNLTFDFSEAPGGTWIRAISAAADLIVDNCTFIGSDNYTKDNAVMIGDTNASVQINASAIITNCTFENWRRGVSDNENAKEVKSIVISGNTFESANVYVSAYESVSFTGNTMSDACVNITSYTNAANVKVVVTDNALDEEYASYNVIGSASKLFTIANVVAQSDIKVNAQ